MRRGFTIAETLVTVAGLSLAGYAAVTVAARQSDPQAPQRTVATVAAAPPKQLPPSPVWYLRLATQSTGVGLPPIANPDASEAWGAGPRVERIYGGRPGDGSPDQERRLRELTYAMSLCRDGHFYTASENSTDGTGRVWTIPAAEWNPSGPNTLYCASPDVPPIIAEK